MAVIELNGKNFETEVLKSAIPVLVDFYTSWCMPCKAIAPVLEELANGFKGRLKFCRLDIEKEPDFAMKYGVMSVPMLIVFHGGKVVGGRAGATDKEMLKAEIETVLAKIEKQAKEKRPKMDSVED